VKASPAISKIHWYHWQQTRDYASALIWSTNYYEHTGAWETFDGTRGRRDLRRLLNCVLYFTAQMLEDSTQLWAVGLVVFFFFVSYTPSNLAWADIPFIGKLSISASLPAQPHQLPLLPNLRLLRANWLRFHFELIFLCFLSWSFISHFNHIELNTCTF